MKKRVVIAFILLILLTTISTKQKIIFSNFHVTKIEIHNNILISEREIVKLLNPILDKNIIFLNNAEIEKLLLQNTFIESFNVKKKYPNTIKIKIFEKQPIAILFDKKKKYYLSKKIELIEFNNINNFKNLPYVFGNKSEFKVLYNNLAKIDFPFDKIKRYTLFGVNRWDLETIDNSTIRLPPKNYTKSLKNYLDLMNKKEFRKYKVFDYRINNQLILK
jgi:cell division septal protein FtsQ